LGNDGELRSAVLGAVEAMMVLDENDVAGGGRRC